MSYADFRNPYYTNQQKYHFLKKLLNASDENLASCLGLSLNSIIALSKNEILSQYNKQLRFTNLFLLLYNLNFSDKRPKNIYSFINNERIVIDPNDEEDGETSLLSFICAQNKILKELPIEVKELILEYNQGEI